MNQSSEIQLDWKPKFLATGVGSLPYKEIPVALEKIWAALPRAPHWPQLPQCGDESSFVGQYLRSLVETGVIEGYGQPRFQVDAEDWAERMARFYELYLRAEAGDEQAIDSFGFTQQGGAGFEAFGEDLARQGTRQAEILKGQLSGPLTLGMQITDAKRRACYYDDMQRDMLVKAVALHAQWQTLRLKQFGLPVLMSIDDPSLYGFGTSTHVTLDRGTLIHDLDLVAEKILERGGIPGAHVCAGMDWTLLFDTKIQVINFDAYEYFTSMLVVSDALVDYLKRGGILSWGIVPTSVKILGETADTLKLRLEQCITLLVKRGIDEASLRAQSLLTPSCGTGTLAPELADRIYDTLQELSRVMSD